MQIDESPDTEAQCWEHTDATRQNRIVATLAAVVFGGATCCGVAATYYAFLLGGGSILHPSDGIVHSIALALIGAVSAAYCSWAAVTNHPLWPQD